VGNQWWESPDSDGPSVYLLIEEPESNEKAPSAENVEGAFSLAVRAELARRDWISS